METVISNEAVVVSVAGSAYEAFITEVLDNIQALRLNLRSFCLIF